MNNAIIFSIAVASCAMDKAWLWNRVVDLGQTVQAQISEVLGEDFRDRPSAEIGQPETQKGSRSSAS